MRFLFGASLLLLGGCASFYKPPPGAPTADIELNTNMGWTNVQVFSDTSCTRFPSGVRLVWMHDSSSEKTTGNVKTVEAGKEIIITFNRHVPNTISTACALTAAFTPKADNKYRAIFEIDSESCSLVIFNITKDDTNTEIDPSFRGLNRICHDVFN